MQPNTNRTVLVGKGALNRQQLPRDFNNPAAANASHIPRTSSHGNINIVRGLSLHTPLPPSAISSSYAVSTRNENFKPRASPATPNADHASFTPTAALDAQSPYNQPRVDKSGTSRNVTRSRKLQLSDVDWYETPPNTPVASKQKEKPETKLSLNSYVVIGRKQKKAPKKKEPNALGNA